MPVMLQKSVQSQPATRSCVCVLQDGSGVVPREDLKQVFTELFPSLNRCVCARVCTRLCLCVVTVCLCAGACWRRLLPMSSRLQTEPSAEVRSWSCDLSQIGMESHDYIRESANVLFFFIVVDVQTFLSLYKSLFADCTTVVSVNVYLYVCVRAYVCDTCALPPSRFCRNVTRSPPRKRGRSRQQSVRCGCTKEAQLNVHQIHITLNLAVALW